ncbi:MAG: hypothetical protein NTV86_09195 [Planctomycetota bacterium]|nr:hypothetical protein [Planctomycetota bacterium]
MGEKIDTRQLLVVRRIIYLLVALAVIVPYLVKLPLPFAPLEDSRKVFDRVEALPAGSHVLISMDFDPSAEAELRPMANALLAHCFQKGLIPVVMTNWNTGLTLVDGICKEAAGKAGKISGKDWVFLGFRPGFTDLIVNMGENLKGAFTQDYYGKSTQGMGALAGVASLKNIDLIVNVAAGSTVEAWIAYAADRHKIPFAAGTTAVMAPDMYPWLNSGQMAGLLGGLRGAADYELLVRQPGDAAKGMQVQSVSHVLLIVLIVAANIRFFVGRRPAKRGA